MLACSELLLRTDSKPAPIPFGFHICLMSSLHLLRFASRTQPKCLLNSQLASQRIRRAPVMGCVGSFSTSVKRQNNHDEETFEEFTARYGAQVCCSTRCRFREQQYSVSLPFGLNDPGEAKIYPLCRYEKEFDNVHDVFELQVPIPHHSSPPPPSSSP